MSARAAPRQSASVILVRDAPAGGLETFMVRRHARSPVAPSAFVFPGGTVRPDDLAFDVSDTGALRDRPGAHSDVPDAAALRDRLVERSDAPLDVPDAAALYVAALRELFEEAGVLLVHDRSGRLLEVDQADTALQERLESTRLALQARELTVSGVFADWQWTPAFEALVPFSHWVTPDILAARFDTRFFVAEMPPAQAALHDTIETSEGLWLSPSQALAPAYHTVYATAAHLRRLVPFDSVAALLQFARAKPIRRVQPEAVESPEGLSVWIPEHLQDAW